MKSDLTHPSTVSLKQKEKRTERLGGGNGGKEGIRAYVEKRKEVVHGLGSVLEPFSGLLDAPLQLFL